MNMIPLSDLVRTKVKSLTPAKYPDSVFNLCSISAFDNGEPEELKGSEIGSSKKILLEGDVVISRIVPHIKRVWEIPNLNENTVLGSGEWIVFNSNKVNNTYLRFFLYSEQFHRQFMMTVKGVGGSLLRADPKQTGEIKIPLPPLPTQKKIAAILDAADAYRQKTKALIEKYDQLAQSLFLDMFGEYQKELIPLKEIMTFSQGQQFPVEQQSLSPKDGFARFLRIVDFTQGDDLRYVPNKEDKYYIQKDDLVIVRYGATAGFVGTNKEGVLANNLFKLNFDRNKLCSTYLFFVFLDNRFKAFIQKEAFGAAMPALSFKVMERFAIPVPPIVLQNQFAERIKLIEQQKKQAQASLQKAEDLFNSLLQRAFKGELT